MELIDLSYTIYDHMPVYPGDIEVSLKQCAFLEKEYYNNIELRTGMHSGTHIDSPGHLTEDKRKIFDFPLAKFIGSAICLDVSNQQNIGYNEDFENLIQENDIVLFHTGQSRKWNTDEYYKNYPVFTEQIADFLLEKKIKIFGIDSPSPDNFPFPIHKKLFSADILIIENLTSSIVRLVNKEFELMAFPLNINSDSSPVRVIARL